MISILSPSRKIVPSQSGARTTSPSAAAGVALIVVALIATGNVRSAHARQRVARVQAELRH